MELPKRDPRALSFALSRGIEINFIEPLGFGQDGRVWKTINSTAVKVFERLRNYTVELECYQRLAEANVDEICGLNVPKLVDFDDELLVVEMEVVKPPYLLDFGKAHLDRAPEFPAETLAEWNEELRDYFGDDVPLVKRVLRRLNDFGIYYFDAKPANIRLHHSA